MRISAQHLAGRLAVAVILGSLAACSAASDPTGLKAPPLTRQEPAAAPAPSRAPAPELGRGLKAPPLTAAPTDAPTGHALA
jgi:hypothetical protein